MNRRRLVAGIALLSAAALAACTSIPVATMWKLARFDRDDFLALDPEQLRAAALVDNRATTANVTLTITLTPKGGAAQAFDLTLAAPLKGDARLPPAPRERRWDVFALSPEGRQAFVRMRATASGMPPDSSLELAVRAREGDVPADLRTAFALRIDLMLDSKDGWFTLLSDRKINLDALKKAG